MTSARFAALARRRPIRLLALTVLLALGASACTAAAPTAGRGSTASPRTTQPRTTQPATGPAGGTDPSTPTAAPSSAHTKPAPAPVPVHLAGYPDGTTVGVGMPIIVTFDKTITSAKAFVADTTVTVNGKKVDGGWFFEATDPSSGHVMEAHYRLKHYWPAHSHVHVSFDLEGRSGGDRHHREFVFDGQLTSLDFHTGARNIGVVDNRTHMLTLTSDGKHYGTFPVSLGEDTPSTRTFRGTKVIMDQQKSVCMQDTAGTYHECGIKWDQRLTYSGEYLHAAPWNCTSGAGCTGPGNNIGHGNSSNGCTNLKPAAAEQLYKFLRIGDVIKYPNADGKPMQLGTGYGDWNVPWSTWRTGGALDTRT